MIYICSLKGLHGLGPLEIEASSPGDAEHKFKAQSGLQAWSSAYKFIAATEDEDEDEEELLDDEELDEEDD